MKRLAIVMTLVLATGSVAAAQTPQGYAAPVLPAGDCSCQPAVVAPPVAVQPAPVVAYRPVVPVQQGLYVGQGAWGQATVYIPGQPVRNFFRAITW